MHIHPSAFSFASGSHTITHIVCNTHYEVLRLYHKTLFSTLEIFNILGVTTEVPVAALASLDFYMFSTAVDLALHVFIRLIQTRQPLYFENVSVEKLLHIVCTVKCST